jgi:hypothetical protein
MRCDDPECPSRPTCCCCDEVAASRCHRCGEFYCRVCFGPGQAETCDPCRDCSVTLAGRDSPWPSPNVIIYGESRAIPTEVEKSDESRV